MLGAHEGGGMEILRRGVMQGGKKNIRNTLLWIPYSHLNQFIYIHTHCLHDSKFDKSCRSITFDILRAL